MRTQPNPWRQIRALMLAELRLFVSDRRAVILYLAVPVFIASFIGSLTGGAGARPSGGMGLWIADEDGTAVSRGVVEDFRRDAGFRVTLTNAAAVRAQVMEGRIPAGVVLPAGLGADAVVSLFETNRRPRIQLLHDPSRAIERQMVEGMLVQKVVRSLAANLFTWDNAQGWVDRSLSGLQADPGLSAEQRALYRRMLEPVREWIEGRRAAAAGAPTNATVRGDFDLPMPFRVDAEAVTARAEAKYNAFAHSFAGIGLQFVLMSMIDLAIGLLRERESGWFKRLRSAPFARSSLLVAKGLAYAVIGGSTLLGSFAFAMVAFGVRIQGSIAGFALTLGLTAMLASSLGLMLAAVGRTPGGTRGVSIAAVLVLVMLGGAWMPTFIFPKWLQTVSMFTPTRWVIDAFDAVTWRALDLGALMVPLGVIGAWTLLFTVIACWRFRWDAD